MKTKLILGICIFATVPILAQRSSQTYEISLESFQQGVLASSDSYRVSGSLVALGGSSASESYVIWGSFSAVDELADIGQVNILEQPQSLTASVGDSVAFTVVAEGEEPLSYQWYKDDIAIPEAIAATHEIASVVGDDAGTYTVSISNAMGTVNSEAATLGVGISITEQPQSLTAGEGDSVTLSVSSLTIMLSPNI